MKRNTVSLPSSDFTYDKTDSSVEITPAWYTGTSSYTIDYLPDGIGSVTPSGVTVSFANDVLNDSVEVYSGSTSRQYKIETDYFPFINYSIINDTSRAGKSSPGFSYESGRWYNYTTSTKQGILPGEYYDVILLTVDGFEATNRTDYYDNVRPALAAYNAVTYPFYEYIHAGKSLYLNTPIYEKEIKIKYKYLNDSIQLRAILRNNNRGNVSNTPTIEDITLKMRTI